LNNIFWWTAQSVEVAWLATERKVSWLADSVPALTGMVPAGEFSEARRQQLNAFSKSAAFYIVVALPSSTAATSFHTEAVFWLSTTAAVEYT